MYKKAAIPVFFLVTMGFILFGAPALAQEENSCKNTITLPSGEVVCDVSGEWEYDCIYECSGFRSPFYNIIKINQEGKNFVGITVTRGRHPKGIEVLKGELDKVGFKTVDLYLNTTNKSGWHPSRGKIKKQGGELYLTDDGGYDCTIKRK